MRPFLDQVADFILADSGPLHDKTVVLPSRRAAIFLQGALQSKLERPALAPRMMSIEELIFELSELQAISRPELFFRLFECFKNGPRPDIKMEEYSAWANALLQDFNEIDRYLIDPQEIFSYLGDLKRIDQWNLEPGEHTRMLDDYLRFWPQLAEVYQSLSEALLKEGKAWQGLAYRQFVKSLKEKSETLEQQYGRFYFIGFNALNKAEEAALLFLAENHEARFFWDVDDYYFNNPEQEAGLFLRRSPLIAYLRKQKQFHGLHRKLESGERQVNSIAVAGNNLQAVVAANRLAEKAPEERSKSAVILSDEGLLPAFLNSISSDFPNLNLSMGLGLQHSPLAGFFELLLDFPLDYERHGKKDKLGWARYHFKRWEALLSHPVSYQIAAENEAQLQEARRKIKAKNLLYPSFADLELEGAFPGLDPNFFKAGKEVARQYQRLSSFCEDRLQELYGQNSGIEGLFGFHQMFQQTADLLQGYPYLETFEQSLQFYRELLPELSIDLKGEPLQGMQVMGWLETRCLDFEHLIIISLNEGILPKGKSDSSLLPFEVKRKFQIPTFLEKDAVFAYHFYRLMQGAKQIDLLYSTAENAVGVVEPSRFIRQLELEWPLRNRKLQFNTLIATGQPEPRAEEEEIQKSPWILKRLEEMAHKGFSPSALYIYLKDPLQFYYERVLGLRPEDEVVEELDLPAMGTAMHEFLEHGFSLPDPNDPQERIAHKPDLESAFFQMSLKQIKTELKERMLAKTKGIPLDSGPNLLHLENMALMLKRFLKAEKERLQKMSTEWDVLAVEKNLNGELELKSGLKVKLIGNADRIDREADLIHIIDYKTGSKEARDFKISELSLEALIKSPHAVQLPTYALMQWQEGKATRVKASILSLKKLSSNPIEMNLENSKELNAENYPEVEALLKNVFEELFDPQTPFKARK